MPGSTRCCSPARWIDPAPGPPPVTGGGPPSSRWSRERRRRLLAAALLCLLVAPGTWWRAAEPVPDGRDILTLRPLAALRPAGWPAPLRLRGIWHLDSPNTRFGGYSALVALPGGRLAAYSDRGTALVFTEPGRGPAAPRFRDFPLKDPVRWFRDIEAATRDPETGRQWIAIETINLVARLDANGRPEDHGYPPQMQDWPYNRGAEAMLRLPDGRFVVLGESTANLGSTAGPGLLYPGDPLAGDAALRFRFVPPRGYRPTDMASLPDGRVLILLRSLDLAVPPFAALLVVADPARIRAGEAWPWARLARISPPLPRDNYEGLAARPAADGGTEIWIISDDNNAGIQRTLLLGLWWDGRRSSDVPGETAPE